MATINSLSANSMPVKQSGQSGRTQPSSFLGDNNFAILSNDSRQPFNGDVSDNWYRLLKEQIDSMESEETDQQNNQSKSIRGTNRADNLRGTNSDDNIDGRNGNDTINGRGGNDQLSGGNGKDTVNGGAGDDRIDGGNGNDKLKGGNGNDFIDGGNGADKLYGGNGDDELKGGAGKDTLRGGAGNDMLWGSYGNDTFIDNEGDNVIDGGRGRDILKLNKDISSYNIIHMHNFFLITDNEGNRNEVSDVEKFHFKDIKLSSTQLIKYLDENSDMRYHSADGTFNNLSNPEIGKTDSPFRSTLEKDTDRSIGGATEVSLPNPREISNAVAQQTESTENSKGLSDMFWLWGQFLDHDINLTPINADDQANIAIPKGDPFFDPTGTGTQEMHFERSVFITGENGERQQTNHITAWIDGSNVYGSDSETALHLREFSGGRLIMDESNMMGVNDQGHFEAGDERSNEHAGLTSMHTLWAREHNRIADELTVENPEWGDQRLYDESRLKVVAQLQAITYNEFLPSLLGENGLGEYQGYDDSVSPQISDAFASAAYRLGHTMISPTLLRLDEEGNEIAEGNLQLRNAFFNPDSVTEAGIDPILRGFSSQTAQAVDPMLVDDIRNFLFGAPGAGGFDLASLNIQRGRDHELPGLNDAREQLGLSRITSFDDPIFKGDFGQKLATVYDHPDDVDLWIGGLAEQEQGDSLVGGTFTEVLKDQFERLRTSDRFWYEKQYSGSELDALNDLKLSDIIKRNTDIQNIQENVLVASNVHQQEAPEKDSFDLAADAAIAMPIDNIPDVSVADGVAIVTDTVRVSNAQAQVIAEATLDSADAEDELLDEATQ